MCTAPAPPPLQAPSNCAKHGTRPWFRVLVQCMPKGRQLHNFLGQFSMLAKRSQFLVSLSIGTHSAQLEVADWACPTPLAGPRGALDHLVLHAAVPEERSRCAVTPIKEVGDNQYTPTSDMPKGHNTCQWLTLSSTERCNKSCLGDFCKIHLAKLCKGSCSLPCLSGGVGVINKQGLCVGC